MLFNNHDPHTLRILNIKIKKNEIKIGFEITKILIFLLYRVNPKFLY